MERLMESLGEIYPKMAKLKECIDETKIILEEKAAKVESSKIVSDWKEWDISKIVEWVSLLQNESGEFVFVNYG